MFAPSKAGSGVRSPIFAMWSLTATALKKLGGSPLSIESSSTKSRTESPVGTGSIGSGASNCDRNVSRTLSRPSSPPSSTSSTVVPRSRNVPDGVWMSAS